LNIESNPWAAGCPQCTYGIVSAPELTRACELYLERLVQAIDGDITFCTCQAGQVYRVYLLNRRQALIEEARRLPLMADFVKHKSHPDIEQARWAMAQEAGKMHRVPTIHYEPPPPPVPTPPAVPVPSAPQAVTA
jgi:hypothetical protein